MYLPVSSSADCPQRLPDGAVMVLGEVAHKLNALRQHRSGVPLQLHGTGDGEIGPQAGASKMLKTLLLCVTTQTILKRWRSPFCRATIKMRLGSRVRSRSALAQLMASALADVRRQSVIEFLGSPSGSTPHQQSNALILQQVHPRAWQSARGVNSRTEQRICC